jgi:hypothetical protein
MTIFENGVRRTVAAGAIGVVNGRTQAAEKTAPQGTISPDAFNALEAKNPTLGL